MDKNASTGLILIMGIMLVWYLFFLPKNEEVKQTPTPVKTAQTLKGDTIPPALAVNDTLLDKKMAEKYGALAPAAKGENKSFTIKTEKLTVHLQTKGGEIMNVSLNEHKNYDGKMMSLVADIPPSKFAEEFTFQNRAISTEELFFQPVGNVPASVSGKDSATLVMRAMVDAAHYLEKSYTFKGDKYDVRYQFNIVGLENEFKDNFYTIDWKASLPRQEKEVKNQRLKTTVIYKSPESVEKLSMSDAEKKEEPLNVNWTSFRSQFFTYAIIPDKPFHKGSFEVVPYTEDSLNKAMEAKLTVDLVKGTGYGYTFLMAPNEYSILEKYHMSPMYTLDLGWGPVKYINVITAKIFTWLEGLNISYGIILLIFGILIKIVVLPMTYKSYMSMAKLRVLNQTPEMKELDAKYADDAQKLQLEKMAIYNKVGVSPFGGCLPMLLQYPIIISMFFFFPQAVELRGQPFLWANDLSTYDSILDLGFHIPGYGDHVSLFTILMAISTFFFTLYTQNTQPSTVGNPAMQMQMKIMTYVMPFILLFFLNNYASGLCWYYFVSNMLAIAQNLLFRYFVDEEKLEAKLHEKRSKKENEGGSSKSWMQQKLEEAQNRQKELAAEKRREKKDGK